MNMTRRWVILAMFFVSMVNSCRGNTPTKPHIIFIMADDLGWNDVGFHGSGQIPTPNIDSLAYSGIMLHNYYVTAICTPSRSALMTGKHPIHTGMQHTVLFGAEPRGLPLNETLLPQHLRDLGYVNHIVGKWHLGSYKKEYLPLNRGFDTHLGYWTGHQDYYDHTAVERPGSGLDMRQGMEPAWELNGKYSTDLFTDEAVRLIHAHNITKPMFLYLSHAAVHSANPYNPLPAPEELVNKFNKTIKDVNRRRFAAILTKLDESVGKVVQALQRNQMLEDSIIVFTTDNGGAAAGFNLNAASNWPLRGVKNTLWEGGVRGAALLWSPRLARPSRLAEQMVHITDWLPTLYSAAGGNVEDLGTIDGIDQWNALSNDMTSERLEILHNIDDIYGNAALTVGEWKLVKGTSYNGAWDSWYGPSGRDVPYDTALVTNSLAGEALASIDMAVTPVTMNNLRKKAEVNCLTPNDDFPPCKPLEAPCLFNVQLDPCEEMNMAQRSPVVLNSLLKMLDKWNATAVPPGNLPLDPRGNPKYWDNTWTNFGDYISSDNIV